MITQKTRDRLNDIMALADAHAYAKIMPGTPWEQLPCTQLEKAVQAVLAENEALRAACDAARLEIASLHAQLEAVGAGGVGPLMAAAEQPAAPEDSAVFDFWRADHMPQSDKSEALAEWCALWPSKPAAQAQPVATIYVTEDGSREVDDWKVPLPVGATTLYTAPQPTAQAQLDAVGAGKPCAK